jgi:SAM-dependent methyltransferase
MADKQPDGSAGDADYATLSQDYSLYRRAEPAIAQRIEGALGSARTVLNVGAGAGSYEPSTRDVTAIEPSASMRAQRPAHLPVALDAVAEKLPFADRQFDAAMATFTVHQWTDLAAGLAEMRRVTKGPVVILSCDPLLVQRFWLNDYAPDVLAAEARRYPPLDRMGTLFGGRVDVLPVPIPRSCTDGFNEAYYGRPEQFLEDGARLACSAWSFVSPEVAAGYVDHLCHDLTTGAWDLRYGHLRALVEFEGSLRLIVARPG